MSNRFARPALLVCLLPLIGCGGGGGGGGGGGPGGGNTIFVRASVGDDRNSGSTATSALRTIQAAVDKAGRGMTIVVGPGRYITGGTESVVTIDTRQGSLDAPIGIVADISGIRTGDSPGDVIVDAGGRPFGFRFTDSSFYTLDGLRIIGTGGQNAAGVHVRGASEGLTIRNCEISTNGNDGVRLEGSARALLFNNAIHTNGNRGIQVGNGTTETRIINNTVAFNTNDGISGSGNAIRGTTVRNNVVYENDGRGIDIRDTALNGYSGDYNLVFQTAGPGTAYGEMTPPGPNDVNEDPLFVDDFFLSQESAGQDDTSPAVDAADPITDPQLADALLARTTATNLEVDRTPLDMGYHYPGPSAPPPTRTLPPGTTPPGGDTPTPPAPTTFYVRASNGRDTNNGQSPNTALRTIQAAVGRAGPGTEIIVGPGLYRENVVFSPPGGSPGIPIVLEADANGELTGDNPGPVVVDGGALGRGIFIDGASNVVVDGFTITNSLLAGVFIRRQAVGVEIRNCEIVDNLEDGIRIQDSDDTLLFNNLVYCNSRRGILIAGGTGSNRTQLVNNSVVQNSDRGVFIGTADAASRNTFMRNNIVQDNGGFEIQVTTEPQNSLAGYNADFNLVYDTDANEGQYFGPTPGPRDINASAVFVDVPTCSPFQAHNNDFRLAQGSAGQSPPFSPALDYGDLTTPARLAAVLRQRTTATDDATDDDPLDLGFHFLP